MRNRNWLRLGLVVLTFAGRFCAAQTAGGIASRTFPGDDDPNRIVKENRNPGSDLWQVPTNGFQVADDNGMQIKGYSGESSAPPGGIPRLWRARSCYAH